MSNQSHDPIESQRGGGSRRQFLAAGGVGALGAAMALPALTQAPDTAGTKPSDASHGAVGASATNAVGGSPATSHQQAGSAATGHSMAGFGVVGTMSPDPFFDPSVYVRSWNTAALPKGVAGEFYSETRRADGTRLREYQFVAWDREIEIAPGLYFPAWTYNGQVPGPTIRATEGDTVRVRFLNQGSHPHTIHFHGWHPDNMDGSFPEQFVEPGATFVYEFQADPVGVHLYHCHSVPLKRHIHKGLYGMFIVDPDPKRYVGKLCDVARTRNPDCAEHADVREFVMMMNAFDLNFDAENEVYAVNTAAFHYMNRMLPVRVGQLVRVYLANITEFDLINSFHLHAAFFDVFRTGTRLETTEHTDTVMMCQAERAILEFRLRYPGRFMFHAHQSEFAELGWMGAFHAVQSDAELARLERGPDFEAPDFTVTDLQGRTVRLSDFRGRSNLVLVFSRGSRCSHCARQIEGLSARSAAFGAHQAEVLVVTPAVEPRVWPALRLLADPRGRAASVFGLSDTGSRTHGTFVIDRLGRVRWQNVSDQPFNGLDVVLAELRKIAGDRA